MSQLAPLTRLSGADRFEASAAVNVDAFDHSGSAFIATGFNFPDVLAGAALAGARTAPLYLAQTNCVPASISAEIDRVGATRVAE